MTPRSISLSFLILAGAFSLAPNLHAGASNKNGNPFGNGTFFQTTGTYSAIERSSNGYLGVMQFSISTTNTSTNSLTNSGVATIYANGQQFSGPAFGSVNGSTIAATYIGIYTSNTCSGQFSASLQNVYPNQIFSGQGQSTVNNNATTINYNTSVSGSRLIQ